MIRLDNIILTFGLSKKQYLMIEEFFSCNFEVINCDGDFNKILDIIAASVIVNPDKMLSHLFSIFDEKYSNNNNQTMIAFTTEPEIDCSFIYHRFNFNDLKVHFRVLNERLIEKCLCGISRHVLNDGLIVLDIETSGCYPQKDEIIRLEAVRIAHNEMVDEFSELITPLKPLSPELEELTKITNLDLVQGIPIEEAINKLLNWHPHDLLVIYNRRFDIGFIENACTRIGNTFERTYLDLQTLVKKLYPNIKAGRPSSVYKALNIPDDIKDAEKNAMVLLKCIQDLRVNGIWTAPQIDQKLLYLIKPGDILQVNVGLLLCKEDKDSNILDKDAIISLLKDTTRNPNVYLPRDMNFYIKNGVLTVFVNQVCDGSAFESWILKLKCWLPQEIQYVELDFDEHQKRAEEYDNSEEGQYNRFLFRIYNFIRMYPEWFLVRKDKKQIVFSFIELIKSKKCMPHQPSLESQYDKMFVMKYKQQIEDWFDLENGKRLLCQKWNLDPEKVFNQFSTDRFADSLTGNSIIITFNKNAVYFWGVESNCETLHLFEFEFPYINTKGIDIISDTLFYAAFWYDTCISSDPLFMVDNFNADTTNKMISNQNDKKILTNIQMHLFSPKYDSLFNDEMISCIQRGINKLGIRFDWALYNTSNMELF